MKRTVASLSIVFLGTCVAGCTPTRATGAPEGGGALGRDVVEAGGRAHAAFGAASAAFWRRAKKGASQAFWTHWGDGKAELSGYRIETPRYGEKREGHVALIYVTEALDRRTLVKDDTGSVPEPERLHVIKLNHTLKFQTGIYPYSVMTSVFAPVADYGLERFFPAKISFTAQEWCGHVFQQLKPLKGRLWSSLASYFSTEGEAETLMDVSGEALYEDALLIQLRELDGPFNGGKDWTGQLVPGLWRTRRAHVPLTPVSARITRGTGERKGKPVNRFVLTFGDVERTYDVERETPRRVLAWSESDGERAELLKTARLPYWQLNRPGDERHRQALGLDP